MDNVVRTPAARATVPRSKIVIVGAGQAGFQVAASLAQQGFEGDITLVGNERGLPYQRPPLSKSYFREAVAERLLFRPAEFFKKNNITLMANQHVTRILRSKQLIQLQSGETLAYTHLVLATGTKSRSLPIAGRELGNVVQLRTLLDADKIRHAARDARHVVMIGGGFIGLETACALRQAGLGVSIVEMAPRVMARVVSKHISELFEAHHVRAGTRIYCNSKVGALEGDKHNKVRAVSLLDGTRIEADLVMICAGVEPDISLASQASLEIGDGINVNENLVTSDPNISAIGDCASFFHPVAGSRIRLESVQNAVDQAKCAAKNIAGTPEAYNRVAWFWSDQDTHKLQIAGLTSHADRWHVLENLSRDKSTVLAFRGDEFIGAETLNNASDHMATRKILAMAGGLSYSSLRDNNFDLRKTLKEKS